MVMMVERREDEEEDDEEGRERGVEEKRGRGESTQKNTAC